MVEEVIDQIEEY